MRPAELPALRWAPEKATTNGTVLTMCRYGYLPEVTEVVCSQMRVSLSHLPSSPEDNLIF